jgi:cysteinyl-tRNA synthetase
VLRYALLSGHYRSQLAWSEDLLNQASASLDRLYGAVRDSGVKASANDYANTSSADFPQAVLAALCDDLNTPEALAAMHAIAGEIHRSEDAEERMRLGEQLLAGGWLLGILVEPAAAHFQAGSEMSANEIEALISERHQARADKNFARADEIRDELTARGVELEDTREGTRWKTASASGSA